ncbi:MAG: flavodoxin-dependent (E)-4-hydroxy-3-methylbut-2-enyl-diphosphate synthase [Bacilli bacterium]|jgi:(E)-4-hydroxy-3-methylbut-2-enyl-diphosphate synthase|nr:flavodoxin-dependent (E)-4-hydroxy-3-methylbut-2-enyl-diphosphate synthase [Bacilli bacterium]
MSRNKRVVSLKGKLLGGNNPILIQTMANLKTSRVEDILRMDEDLTHLGNDLLRLSVLDEKDAEAFKILSSKTSTPLIADIHFNYLFALKAIANGAAAIRINPGNIGSEDKLIKVISAAKEKGLPIRIGVNSGSLPLKYVSAKEEANAYVSALKEVIKVMEDHDFYDLVLSLKSSDPEVTYQAYKKADELFNYPLHIGVTEAGEGYVGALRSSVALVPLLKEGIGDTIRISLTDPPRDEVLAARALLKALGLIQDVPVLVSCPTCGRTQVDLLKVSKIVSKHLEGLNVNLKVAVMGCPVNGPGEAKDADLGLAGGVDSFLVFEHGKPLKSLPEEEAIRFLLSEIDRLANLKKQQKN